MAGPVLGRGRALKAMPKLCPMLPVRGLLTLTYMSPLLHLANKVDG